MDYVVTLFENAKKKCYNSVTPTPSVTLFRNPWCYKCYTSNSLTINAKL